MKTFIKAHLDHWLQAVNQITHAMTLNVVIQQIRQEYNLTAGQVIYLYISMRHEFGAQFPLWNSMLLWIYA